MRQHISPAQLDELSEKGKERLAKWQEKKYGRELYDPFGLGWMPEEMNIGQMIEFLGDDYPMSMIKNNEKVLRYYKTKELTDALWSATKEILNA